MIMFSSIGKCLWVINVEAHAAQCWMASTRIMTTGSATRRKQLGQLGQRDVSKLRRRKTLVPCTTVYITPLG